MNKLDKEDSFAFIQCKSIWFIFLTELNWNPNAINPLEIIIEFYSPELLNTLIELKFIGQDNRYYLRESDRYMDYLSKGGIPFKPN
tara:strand:- start:17 stop:274 length:258 start_codon:yes stop_codon:yes gene_type:complete